MGYIFFHAGIIMLNEFFNYYKFPSLEYNHYNDLSSSTSKSFFIYMMELNYYRPKKGNFFVFFNFSYSGSERVIKLTIMNDLTEKK